MSIETRASINGEERRTHTIELRVDNTLGKKPTIRGYAAKFNSLSETMPIIVDGEQVGTFREQLLPGCFASAIPTSDCRALFNHDPNMILGRTSSGTLRLSEDRVGLAFEVDPPDTTYSRNLQVSMGRQDINQCSFGFCVASGGDSYAKDPAVVGGWIRSIRTMAKLFDVSPVTYPAYVDTNCAVRSIVGMINDEKTEIEKRVAAQIAEETRAAELVAEEARVTEEARVAEEKRVADELAETEALAAEETRKIEVERMKLELELMELS